MGGWWGEYSFRCQPVDNSASPTATRMVHACWWYYFSKFTEFFDTFFFVLRKKNSQVSTLHVIHHGCMPMSVWFGVKFTPGGHSTFFGLLNTFVHIVMYSYYLFSALGQPFQKFLWWKKYLTALQMVQFVAIMVHAFQLLFIDCNYPRAFVWWIGMHAVMFFFLFNEFYKSTYKYGTMSFRLRSAEHRAVQKKLQEIEQDVIRTNQNGKTPTSNGLNGSVNQQYYDTINHHNNNKQTIEYTESYYGNGNGTTELINRKK